MSKVLKLLEDQIEETIDKEAKSLKIKRETTKALIQNILITLNQLNRKNCVNWGEIIRIIKKDKGEEIR